MVVPPRNATASKAVRLLCSEWTRLQYTETAERSQPAQPGLQSEAHMVEEESQFQKAILWPPLCAGVLKHRIQTNVYKNQKDGCTTLNILKTIVLHSVWQEAESVHRIGTRFIAEDG